MSKLTWDALADRKYETGVSKGVYYPYNSANADYPYRGGKAWNGLTAVNESADGADITTLYADNIEYLHIMSPEKFGITIECYNYPDEFAECIGKNTGSGKATGGSTYSSIPGFIVTGQSHKTFGFSYRTEIGSEANNELGYKIHIVYGVKSAPSDENRDTINDSPAAMTYSFECSTTPDSFPSGYDYKPTAHVIIDSTKIAAAKLTLLENLLYGTDGTPGSDPELPTLAWIASNLL